MAKLLTLQHAHIQCVYIYIYAVRLGSGPIFAILMARFWPNCLKPNKGVDFLGGAKQVNTLMVRFWPNSLLVPKIGPEPTIKLGRT